MPISAEFATVKNITCFEQTQFVVCRFNGYVPHDLQLKKPIKSPGNDGFLAAIKYDQTTNQYVLDPIIFPDNDQKPVFIARSQNTNTQSGIKHIFGRPEADHSPENMQIILNKLHLLKAAFDLLKMFEDKKLNTSLQNKINKIALLAESLNQQKYFVEITKINALLEKQLDDSEVQQAAQIVNKIMTAHSIPSFDFATKKHNPLPFNGLEVRAMQLSELEQVLSQVKDGIYCLSSNRRIPVYDQENITVADTGVLRSNLSAAIQTSKAAVQLSSSMRRVTANISNSGKDLGMADNTHALAIIYYPPSVTRIKYQP